MWQAEEEPVALDWPVQDPEDHQQQPSALQAALPDLDMLVPAPLLSSYLEQEQLSLRTQEPEPEPEWELEPEPEAQREPEPEPEVQLELEAEPEQEPEPEPERQPDPEPSGSRSRNQSRSQARAGVPKRRYRKAAGRNSGMPCYEGDCNGEIPYFSIKKHLKQCHKEVGTCDNDL